jgi:hypothetical protein
MHHFSLGTESTAYQTTHGRNFPNAHAQVNPNQQAENNAFKAKISRHNFDFGSDPTSKVSVAQAAYAPRDVKFQ